VLKVAPILLHPLQENPVARDGHRAIAVAEIAGGPDDRGPIRRPLLQQTRLLRDARPIWTLPLRPISCIQRNHAEYRRGCDGQYLFHRDFSCDGSVNSQRHNAQLPINSQLPSSKTPKTLKIPKTLNREN
jgi:hypothetical protein